MSPGRRTWALLLLATGGAALAALPHAVAWIQTGDPNCLADGDGLIDLAWSRGVVLHGDLRISGAVHRSSGPMMPPRLLFVPPGLAARRLGLGWRAWGWPGGSWPGL